MAEVKFDFKQAFKEVWGAIPIPTLGNDVSLPSSSLPQYSSPGLLESNILPGKDRITPGTGIVLADRLRFDYGTDEGVASYGLPHESVAEYSQAKNIVKTLLQGRDGTIKEYINLDDWVISIRGFIINYDSLDYPLDQIINMSNFFQLNTRLKVGSDWMSRLGIKYVITEALKFPVVDGLANAQPYELELVSDNPFEIELLEIK